MSRKSVESDAAWESLMPGQWVIHGFQNVFLTMRKEGRGFVLVEHPEAYNLLPGIPTDVGPDRYSVSMFHQLHCLVSQTWLF